MHRPNRAPAQRFRFEQYLPALDDAGIEHRQTFFIDARGDERFYAAGSALDKVAVVAAGHARRAVEVARGDREDVVFVQREAAVGPGTWWERLLARGRRLVYDFDDAIWIRDVSEANRRYARLKPTGKVEKLAGEADLVLAGNEYLASYARRFSDRVAVFPTTIDTDRYRPRPPTDDERVVIGWSGSRSTLAHLRTVLPALEAVHRRYGDRVRFEVVGDQPLEGTGLPVDFVRWTPDGEVDALHRFDIGIMPLPDNEWTQGKCGCKGLQYMGCAIPAVVSPVGVNRDIVTDGDNGMWATTTDEWVDRLGALVEDADLRARVGAAGRRTVVEHYSVAATAPTFVGYLRDLAAGRDPLSS
ncbi:MAG: glycosyltransferase family 4 protein [Actinomycetota bacterium]|nr:glycosyltransferase family 4 protein [Actinomycetota bacterium]